MRFFTFKGLLLTTIFMLLGCLSIQAEDDDLITKQVTVKLDEAGTLPDKIGSAKKYKITNLKIIGEINGTDWRMIRDMAGRNVSHDETEGNLSELDLSDASIVSGGDYYITCAYFGYPSKIHTSHQVIGDLAFEGCSGLTSLKLPSDIRLIGRHAFKGCSGLTSITLPSGVTEIGSSAFYGCSGLTSITLPSGVTWIGHSAFEGCSGLTSITLPSGVTEIGKSAFANCSGLTSIYVYAEKMPKLRTNMFDGCDAKKCTVYVPKGTYDDYWLSEFGYFENIVEFDPTGINNVITSNDAKELSRYSVNGQRLSAPTKGLNIVKYSDGSVKKVAVQ